VLKRIIAPIALSGAFLAGATSLGVASSAYASTPSLAIPQSINPALKAWIRAHRRQIAQEVVTVSSTTIGVSSQDLVSELRSGKSIADVASENSVSAQTVVNALVNAADAEVNQAVTNQKLTSAQASKIEAALPGYATTLVNHVF
jgi:hypothetical protein